MRRFVIVSALSLALITPAFAQNLSGNELKKTFPGNWKMITKKGASGSISFKRDGSGRMAIGSYNLPIIWKIRGNKICVWRLTPKDISESCNTVKKLGSQEYKNSNGTTLKK